VDVPVVRGEYRRNEGLSGGADGEAWERSCEFGCEAEHEKGVSKTTKSVSGLPREKLKRENLTPDHRTYYSTLLYL
jgi:hypothetical protein